jgi:hypothetical protein
MLGAIRANHLPRQTNWYGQACGDHASSRTDPDDGEPPDRYLRIRYSCSSPCSPEDSGVIWCGLGLHHPVQRPCFDFLLEPDCCVLITGCEPVTEPHAGEALVAEQYGHALSRAVAGDDDLGVVVHPLDEGEALPGRFREPIGLRNRPAAAEEAIDAGTLSLQLCAAGGVGRHGTMIGPPARPGPSSGPAPAGRAINVPLAGVSSGISRLLADN